MSIVETRGGFRQEDPRPSSASPPPKPSDSATSAKPPRKVLVLLPLLVSLIVAGCGGASSHPSPGVTQPAAPFACHPKTPPQAGECIRQELEAEGVKPTEPRPSARFGAAFHVQGIDISRWQPHPRFRELYREGIRFVIVQGADGCSESNPFFDSQVQSAHEAGMRIGVYVFAEGCSPAGQAAALKQASTPERSRITLGAAVDAEVPAAYPVACAVASALSHHFHIIDTYGSPGTYRGGRCTGGNWPAEWSLSVASPLPGYPFSTVKVRQWCGTCTLGGNDGQIDRDEDLGLLALAHPKPKPISPARRRALVRYWTAERKTTLHRYRLDGCRGNSTGPKCTALRRREHKLYLDIKENSR